MRVLFCSSISSLSLSTSLTSVSVRVRNAETLWPILTNCVTGCGSAKRDGKPLLSPCVSVGCLGLFVGHRIRIRGDSLFGSFLYSFRPSVRPSSVFSFLLSLSLSVSLCLSLLYIHSFFRFVSLFFARACVSFQTVCFEAYRSKAGWREKMAWPPKAGRKEGKKYLVGREGKGTRGLPLSLCVCVCAVMHEI